MALWVSFVRAKGATPVLLNLDRCRCIAPAVRQETLETTLVDNEEVLASFQEIALLLNAQVVEPNEEAKHDDYRQRVREEQADLEGKIERLMVFMRGSVFAALSPASQDMLMRQVVHMRDYDAVLSQRIATFSEA